MIHHKDTKAQRTSLTKWCSSPLRVFVPLWLINSPRNTISGLGFPMLFPK